METLSLGTRGSASGNEAVVLEVEGSLDMNTVGVFEESLRELVDKKKIKIIVSMKNLTYISSAGIGVLMCFLKQVRNNRGDIILTQLNQGVYRVFEILELHRIFQILNTEQDALNAFGDRAYADRA